jgi:5-methylcytosine-specific restriction protein A
MRMEFSKRTKRDAFVRAEGNCEGCGARLTIGKYHYDHIIPDGLGGEAILDNCAVLCVACHKVKTTTKDVPLIAKTKRIQDRQKGIKKPSCGAESNRHSGAVGAEKRAEQSNPGGGHEVTEHDAQKPYEQKAAGMIPRPAGVALSPAHRNTEAEGSK